MRRIRGTKRGSWVGFLRFLRSTGLGGCMTVSQSQRVQLKPRFQTHYPWFPSYETELRLFYIYVSSLLYSSRSGLRRRPGCLRHVSTVLRFRYFRCSLNPTSGFTTTVHSCRSVSQRRTLTPTVNTGPVGL